MSLNNMSLDTLNEKDKRINELEERIEELEERVKYLESESPKNDLFDWITSNFDEAVSDKINRIITQYVNKYEVLDDVDIDFCTVDIVEEIKEGILNVISTYEID